MPSCRQLATLLDRDVSSVCEDYIYIETHLEDHHEESNCEGSSYRGDPAHSDYYRTSTSIDDSSSEDHTYTTIQHEKHTVHDPREALQINNAPPRRAREPWNAASTTRESGHTLHHHILPSLHASKASPTARKPGTFWLET